MTMPRPDAQDKYLVPGLERGLRVLCEVGKGELNLTAPELARRLQVPRTTVFRLLSTLEHLGFVARTDSRREFGLGMSVLRLGFEYLSSLALTQHGLPVLEALRDECDYSCHLVVRDGAHIVYVAKVASERPLASSVNVGTRLPAHATALGRVLLQDMDIDALRQLFPVHPLPAHSPSTPTSVDALAAMLELDRARGHVYSEGFFEPGISTVAAAVRDGNGQIVAALGVTIPQTRIDADALRVLVQRAHRAASDLSARLAADAGADVTSSSSRISSSFNGTTAQ